MTPIAPILASPARARSRAYGLATVFSIIFSLFLSFFANFPANAQEAPPPAVAPEGIPLQFDPRERIARPDLSGLQRIRFLTTVDFAPFNFIDQTGKLGGFHVDLAREICRELRVVERCQIEAMPYGELIAALERGEGDAVAAGVKVTAALRERFAFSRPFLQLPARFAARRSGIATPGELDGKVVGVIGGTAHEAMLKAFFPAIKPKAVTNRDALVKALGDESVAAIFGDGRHLSFWVASAASKACCRLVGGPYHSQGFLGEGLTLMVRRQDAVLAAAFDHALVQLARAGKLNELYRRYFPNGL